VQASVLGIPYLAILRCIVASKDPINAQAFRLSSDATVTQDWLSRGPQRHDSTDAPLRHFVLSLTLLGSGLLRLGVPLDVLYKGIELLGKHDIDKQKRVELFGEGTLRVTPPEGF
jgi:hypothetical protein